MMMMMMMMIIPIITIIIIIIIIKHKLYALKYRVRSEKKINNYVNIYASSTVLPIKTIPLGATACILLKTENIFMLFTPCICFHSTFYTYATKCTK